MNLKSSWYFIASAVMLSLAFDFPQFFNYLSLFFLVPIFIYIEETKGRFNLKKDFLMMFAFSLAVGYLSTYWFAGLYPLDWVNIDSKLASFAIVFFVWAILGIFLALPISLWIVVVRLCQLKNKFYIGIYFALAWIFLEYFRAWIMAIGLYSPQVVFGPHHAYYSLGYLGSGIPYLKELLPMGGMYLTAFVIVLVNYFLFLACIYFKKRENKNQIISIFFLILVLVSFSNIYMNHLRKSGQANIFNFYLGNSNLPSTKDKNIYNLKSELGVQKINEIISKNDTSNLFILPENVDVYSKFVKDKKTFAKDISVVGSYTGKKERMFSLDTVISQSSFYDKKILMPIGEYNISYISFFTQFSKVMGNSMPRVEKGEGSNVLNLNGISFVGSICSENISPYLFRNGVRDGGAVLVNIASHAPFGYSGLLDKQTIAINTTRALETGRYFITATNVGNSFVISDEGKLTFKTKDLKDELSFSENFAYTKSYKTPYVKFGDYIVYIALAFFFNYFVYVFKRSRIP